MTNRVFIDSLKIPDFTIYTINDSTDFRTKDIPKEGIVLIKYFSPDCEHCQEEAQYFVSLKDSLKNVKTIWLSGDWTTLDQVEGFSRTYQLEQLNPLAIGREINREIIDHYDISGLPFAVIYNNNQLIKTFNGSIDFEELKTINNGSYIHMPETPEDLNTMTKSD
ncbi:TlpA family protein disulfide reductase [Winogradskyella tangerina]|uniref:TlpA family protein disulfide reductase n=1 Tax=Winogradskyella tangerina TaxID=2023240 RepID=UPI0013009AF0|nr:redoxin domain-containing protein [Winogradskyella tangerina]